VGANRKENNMTPQAKNVLRYMTQKGPISQLRADKEFNIDRLAARIYDLRKAGIPIKSRTMKAFSGKRYAEYYIDWSTYAASNFRG
jgi:hypothetical protein